MIKNNQTVNNIPHYEQLPDILQDYIKYKAVIENKTFKTVRAYTYNISFFLRYLVAQKNDRDISEVSTANIEFLEKDFFKSVNRSDVLEYLFFLKSTRKNSTNTRYRQLEAIKSFFKYLYSEKIIDENVVADIDLPNLEQTLPKYLVKEETFELLENIPRGADYERNYCIITVFLSCGLRLSELVNIDISDIKGNVLRVHGKGNKEREFILLPLCVNSINQYLLVRGKCEKQIIHKSALFISRKTGKRIGERRVQQIVKETLKLIGRDDLSTHKLRHTMATLAYQGGADIRVLKDVLGHENLSTTEIYTHLNNEQIKEAIYKNPLAAYHQNNE